MTVRDRRLAEYVASETYFLTEMKRNFRLALSRNIWTDCGTNIADRSVLKFLIPMRYHACVILEISALSHSNRGLSRSYRAYLRYELWQIWRAWHKCWELLRVNGISYWKDIFDKIHVITSETSVLLDMDSSCLCRFVVQRIPNVDVHNGPTITQRHVYQLTEIT